MSSNRGLSLYLNSRPNYHGNKQQAEGSISLNTSSILEPEQKTSKEVNFKLKPIKALGL
jgi:hypothetical protein